jgi:hypothetical protein
MKILRPNLAVVEARLSGPSDALLDRFLNDPESLSPELRAAIERDTDAQERLRDEARTLEQALELDDQASLSESSPTMAQMLELHALLDRREATRELENITEPAPGQIRLVEQIVGPLGVADYELPTPLAVVLNEPAPDEPGVWYGWMASPDPDYASPWDLILEDDLADPMASVVQCWNSVLVYLQSTTLVIGQLSEQRLAAVRALADDYAFGEEVDPGLADPGRRVERLVDGHRVLTGTPIGLDGRDPRYDYQLLYHEAAEPIRVCARDALEWAAESAEVLSQETEHAGVSALIRDFIAEIVERFRERTRAIGAEFREVALVPTPAGTETEGHERRIELANVLQVTLYSRATGEVPIVHGRFARLGSEPVTLELQQDAATVAHEILDDDQPTVDLPLSGGARLVVRIIEPVDVEVELPGFRG